MFPNAEQASLIHLSYSYLMQKSRVRGYARISPGISAWQPKTDVNYLFFLPSPELLLNANEGCGGGTAVTLSFSLCRRRTQREDVRVALYHRETALLEQNSVSPRTEPTSTFHPPEWLFAALLCKLAIKLTGSPAHGSFGAAEIRGYHCFAFPPSCRPF